MSKIEWPKKLGEGLYRTLWIWWCPNADSKEFDAMLDRNEGDIAKFALSIKKLIETGETPSDSYLTAPTGEEEK